MAVWSNWKDNTLVRYKSAFDPQDRLPARNGPGSTNMTEVMQRDTETGQFRPTDAETVAREYIRENTRFLRYFV